MEDYLDDLWINPAERGYVTTVDILKYLNKSSPSVTKLIKKLDEKDYLMHDEK